MQGQHVVRLLLFFALSIFGGLLLTRLLRDLDLRGVRLGGLRLRDRRHFFEFGESCDLVAQVQHFIVEDAFALHEIGLKEFLFDGQVRLGIGQEKQSRDRERNLLH